MEEYHFLLVTLIVVVTLFAAAASYISAEIAALNVIRGEVLDMLTNSNAKITL